MRGIILSFVIYGPVKIWSFLLWLKERNIEMSKIVYIPGIEKGRYLHLSYNGESCAIRDFIASGDRPCRDYQTSQVAKMITDCIPADRVPVADLSFWKERLKEVTKNRLGEKAEVDIAPPIYKSNTNSFSKINAEDLESNNFSGKKPTVIFYGERGIVNDELLIMFEAKRKTFREDLSELTYQVELNYAIGKHFTEINTIPSVINLEPIYSSEANKTRGFRGGAIRKLYTNDEHKYFFADFVKCSKFSCLSLTRDKNEKQIADYYRNTNSIELSNLSWIGYDSTREIIDKYNLEWTGAHLEMNKRHFGLY